MLPDQHQIDEQQHDDEDVQRLIAASHLVEGQASPADVIAAGKCLGCHLLDRLDGVTAAITIGRSALNGRSRIGVVSGDLVQPLFWLQGHEGGVGNHLALFVGR